MKKLTALTLLLTAPLACAEIVTRDVNYEAGRINARGFVAAPADGQKHPGILLAHAWWGQNAEIRKRARMLAELGYSVLALDMFGEGKASDHLTTAAGHAAIISGNMPEMKARFRAAMKFLQAQEETDPKAIAAVGYGFGGTVVLQMARNGQRGLQGVASIHGPLRLHPPNPPAKVTAKVLVCHGGEDPMIKPEHIDTFKKDMTEAGADLKFVTYPDAFHDFTNPKATSIGEQFSVSFQYDAKADNASWRELEAFLTELFSPDKGEAPE